LSGGVDNSVPPSALPPGTANNPHKDSALIGIDISKQLLAFSLAGLGFVVGFITAGSISLGAVPILGLLFFALSMVAGVLFLMSVVGHINRDSNYDIYTGGIRTLAVIQIICFAVAAILVTKVAFEVRSTQKPNLTFPVIEIKMGTNEVHQPMFTNSAVSINIISNGLTLSVQPKP
jgi:hypothetical protein